MKKLNEYNGVIFFGGGVMAERIYRQIDDIENRLIAVFDTLGEDRRVKEFNDMKIKNAREILPLLKDENNAIVVTIGHLDVYKFVNRLLEEYGFIEDRLFVINPYQSLRFFMLDDRLAAEVRIPFDDERYTRVRNLFKDDGSLKIFDKLVSSKPFENIDDTYELVPYNEIKDMYYYDEQYWEPQHLDPEKRSGSATVLDCGAYIGDSVEPICDTIPENEIYYYAIEPLKSNIKIMKDNDQLEKICTEFHILGYGVGENDEKLYFHLPSNGDPEGGSFSNDPDGAIDVLEVKKIDSMDVDYKGNVYIKMDIEGLELQALKGAIETIRRHTPCLSICVHHKKNDLVEIPLFIDSLGVSYDYYLRGGYHTVLMAIPKEA